jgi:DNA-binding MarR family transcriptional regulator
MTTLPPGDTLDPLLHQPLRTQIAAYLVGRGEATFSELKRVLQCTDGNLDAHLKKLVAADYVAPERSSQEGARAHTTYSLTPAGRAAFSSYLLHLQKLFDLAQPGLQGAPLPARAKPRPA